MNEYIEFPQKEVADFSGPKGQELLRIVTTPTWKMLYASMTLGIPTQLTLLTFEEWRVLTTFAYMRETYN